MRVAHAVARPKLSARSSTDTATNPMSASWMAWKVANQVDASYKGPHIHLRLRMNDLETREKKWWD
jgi:hypothetical protein